jgi:hypothetical protein
MISSLNKAYASSETYALTSHLFLILFLMDSAARRLQIRERRGRDQKDIGPSIINYTSIQLVRSYPKHLVKN